MGMIVWKEQYSVSLKDVDNQHKKLFELINLLNEAMKEGKGKDVIAKVLEELLEYTKYHFGHEEKYFDMYNYPERVSHKNEHEAFKAKIVEARDNLAKGLSSGTTIEISNFLYKWLDGHILKIDKKYSQFFEEKGVV